MIAYLNGTIMDITEDSVILEVNNVGFQVRISSDTASKLPGAGMESKLYTYTYVREDAFLLYGFLSPRDLEIFKQCIAVNGIGPKGALAILSVLDGDSLRLAIISGDVKAISAAPGIGRKTAERLILDLKDKISSEDISNSLLGSNITAGQSAGIYHGSAQSEEALEALTSLGYGRTEAMKAVTSIEGAQDMDTGAILKAALKKLM